MRRPYQWLFATDRQFHGMHLQMGSVSALASWHDFAFMKKFETVSDARPTQDAGHHHILSFRDYF